MIASCSTKVSSRIYYNDGMYDGDGAHYYKVGLSAIHCIDEALERAKLTEGAHDPRFALWQRTRDEVSGPAVSRGGDYGL